MKDTVLQFKQYLYFPLLSFFLNNGNLQIHPKLERLVELTPVYLSAGPNCLHLYSLKVLSPLNYFVSNSQIFYHFPQTFCNISPGDKNSLNVTTTLLSPVNHNSTDSSRQCLNILSGLKTFCLVDWLEVECK